MFAKYLGVLFKKGGTERIMYLDYVSRINTKPLLIKKQFDIFLNISNAYRFKFTLSVYRYKLG